MNSLRGPAEVIQAEGGVSRRLAEHAASLSYEMLPADSVELTKLCIMDTLGVIIGANTLKRPRA